MRKLAEKNVGRVIDLLNERLAFERTGVKLYDRMLLRMRLSADREIKRMVDRMQRFRDEEREHEEWLEDQIRNLHGDDHMPTDKSVLVLTETQGIERVVQRDPRLQHDFHALLTAELADSTRMGPAGTRRRGVRRPGGEEGVQAAAPRGAGTRSLRAQGGGAVRQA